MIRVYDEAGNVIETYEHGQSPGNGCLHQKFTATTSSDGSGGQLSFDHSHVATEALLMKMKIFKGSDLQSLENKINEWLEAKGINLIHHITHANNLSTTIITIWWGE